MTTEIKIEKIYATNDDELARELTNLGGRIISVEVAHDGFYKVIYEISY